MIRKYMACNIKSGRDFKCVNPVIIIIIEILHRIE
jgi:hypothetical protein